MLRHDVDRWVPNVVYIHHELGCVLESVEMEKCQQSTEDVADYGALTEHLTAWRVRVRGLLPLVSTTNAKKHMKFVNRDFNAANSISR